MIKKTMDDLREILDTNFKGYSKEEKIEFIIIFDEYIHKLSKKEMILAINEVLYPEIFNKD